MFASHLHFRKFARRQPDKHRRRKRLELESLEVRDVPATFTVTNLADTLTAGTLRTAITNANNTAGPDTITFSVAGTINVATVLPTLTESVLLDGWSAPGFRSSPVVELRGSQSQVFNGLNITGNGITVRGLAINGFRGKGIAITGTGAVGTHIAGNYIGTDLTGTAAVSNQQTGVYVENGPTGTVIGTNGDGVTDGLEGNVISSNGINAQFLFGETAGGIYVRGAATANTVIAGNRIGTNAVGTAAIANALSGVIVQEASTTRIGTDGNGTSDLLERNLISGNGVSQANGAGIDVSGSRVTIIAGNLIGTTLAGIDPLTNTGGGIVVREGAINLVIGTNGDGVGDDRENNVIVGGGGAGVIVTSSSLALAPDGIRIAGNTIGNDGTNRIGTNVQGINLAAVKNAFVGTNGDGVSDLLEGNVISGNGEGVTVGSAVTGFRIAGNRIGTNAEGTAVIPGTNIGVRIGGSQTNAFVGTNGDGITDDLEGNLISGATLAGVSLESASGVRIAGNRIGTNAAGTAALPNNVGMQFFPGAGFNVVGTNADGISDDLEGNLISGNNSTGLGLSGNSNFNRIAGNRIGTDVTGTVALANKGSGIDLLGSVGNVVGTNGDGVGDAVEGNLISGNAQYGLRVSILAIANSGDNIVAGNRIGTNLVGTTAVANGLAGVYVSGTVLNPNTNTRIGTNADGLSDDIEGNLISGNASQGVLIDGDGAIGTRIAGNRIGTTADGSAALGNALEGITVQRSSGTIIGTNGDGNNDLAERNIISGNVRSGIVLAGTSAQNNVIAGNFIGTNITGASALPNGQQGDIAGGVSIFGGASNNRIGTDGNGVADEAERNVISGNLYDGILIGDPGSNFNRVSGNYLGTDASGSVAIPNRFRGVEVFGGPMGTLIGVDDTANNPAAMRNVISGNGQNGVEIGLNARDTVFAGNVVGLKASVNALLRNNGSGIIVYGNATNTLVGTNANGKNDDLEQNIIAGNFNGIEVAESGTQNTVIAGNFIGFNFGHGVLLRTNSNKTFVRDNTLRRNTGSGIRATDGTFGGVFSRNVIQENGALGIDLGEFGANRQRTERDAAAANRGINSPVITGVFRDGENYVIGGTFFGPGGGDYRIELFANSVDNAAETQADVYLGFTNISSDGSFFTFSFNFPASLLPDVSYRFFTATATSLATDPDGTSELGEQFEFIEGPPVIGEPGISILFENGSFTYSGSQAIQFSPAGGDLNRIHTLTIDVTNGTIVVDEAQAAGFGISVASFGASVSLTGTAGSLNSFLFDVGTTYIPTTFFSGPESIQISVAADGADTATTTGMIQVLPVADPPTLTLVSPVVALIGVETALSVTASPVDPDGSEEIDYVDFYDFPLGAFNVGRDNDRGGWRVDVNDLPGLTFTPSLDAFPGTYILIVRSAARDRADFGGSPILDLSEETEALLELRIPFRPEIGTQFIITQENSSVFLPIALSDGDDTGGDYTLQLTTGLGDLTFDTFAATNIYNLTISVITSQNVVLSGSLSNLNDFLLFSGVTFAPPTFYSGLTDLGISLTDPDTLTAALTTTIQVLPVVGLPRLNVVTPIFNPNTTVPFPVTISVDIDDPDGSETIDYVRIANYPDGTIFNVGQPGPGNNVWELTIDELPGLMLTFEGAARGIFDLVISTRATDRAAGFNASLPGNADDEIRTSDEVRRILRIDNRIPPVVQLADGYFSLEGPPNNNVIFINATLSEPVNTNTTFGPAALSFKYVYRVQVEHGTVFADMTAAEQRGLTITGNGTQTLTITGDLAAIQDLLNLNVVLMYPPSYFSGEIRLSASLASPDGRTGFDDTILQVVPIASAPIITVQPIVTGNPGETVPLGIQVQETLDRDGSESLTVLISGVPRNASLSAGVNLGNTVWMLTRAQLEGLSILLPLVDTNFQLTIQATISDLATYPRLGLDDQTATSQNFAIQNVRVVLNTPLLRPSVMAPASFKGFEDTTTLFNRFKFTDGTFQERAFQISDPDFDANPAGIYTVYIRTDRGNLFISGVTTTTPGGSVVIAGSGSPLLTLSGTLPELNELLKVGFSQFIGDNYSGETRVTLDVTDPDNLSGAGSTTVRIHPGPDLPVCLLLPPYLRGSVNEGIPLNLVVTTSPDTDGSETVYAIIGGFPLGTTLSAGVYNPATNEYRVEQADFGNLVLFPPTDFDGQIFLFVTAFVEDRATYPSFPAPDDQAVEIISSTHSTIITVGTPNYPLITVPARVTILENGETASRAIFAGPTSVNLSTGNPQLLQRILITFTIPTDSFGALGRFEYNPLDFAATINGNGTAMLTVEGNEFEIQSFLDAGFSVVPRDYTSGDLRIMVMASTLETGLTDFAELVVRVRPVASQPSIQINGATSSALTLSSGPFNFPANFVDSSVWPDRFDFSEFGFVTFTLSEATAGGAFTLFSPFGLFQSSPTTWSTFGLFDPDQLQAVLDSIVLTPPSGYVGSVRLTVEQFIIDNVDYSTDCTFESVSKAATATIQLTFVVDLTVTTTTATGTEGVPTDLANTITLSDSSYEPGQVHSVELSATSGTIFVNPNALSPLVSVTSNGTGTVQITGDFLQIQSLLATPDAISFTTTDPTFAGATTISVSFANTSTTAAPVTGVVGVTIDPVASVITPTAESFTVMLGQSVPVTITLPAFVDLDGSEQVVVFIENVVGSFDAGTNLGGGRWMFRPAELTNLRFFPIFDGTFTFTVAVEVTDTVSFSPISPDTRESRSRQTTTFDVNVIPPIIFDGGTVAENSPPGTVVGKLTADVIASAFTPAGPTVGAIYTFLLDGSTGYDFTVDPDGTIRVGTQNPDFEDVLNRNFTLRVLLQRTFAGVTETVFAFDVPIAVLNVAEPPTIRGPFDFFVEEDTTTVIDGLQFTAPDTIGDVEVVLSIDAGVLIIDTNELRNFSTSVTIENNGTSAVTLRGRVQDINNFLAPPGRLSVTPLLNYSGIASLEVRIRDFITEQPTTQITPFFIAPVADPVAEPLVQSQVRIVNTITPLGITPPSLVDTDGSEVLTILVSGVPTGASLTTGTNLGGGIWRLSLLQLSTVAFVPAPGFIGTVTLTARSEVTDTAFVPISQGTFGLFDTDIGLAPVTSEFITTGVTFTIRFDPAPVLSLNNASVPENRATGTVVGVVSVTPANETFTFSRVSFTGYDFTVDSDGTIRVGNQSPDFEFTNQATVTVQAIGNLGTRLIQTFNITILNVNEAPTIGGGFFLNVFEDTARDGDDILIIDPDAILEPVRVVLTVLNGRLSLPGFNPNITPISIDGNGTNSVILIGPIGFINTLLNASNGQLVYTPDLDYSGMDDFVILVDDLGNTGSGGSQVTSVTRTIDVQAVADTPALTANDAQGSEGDSIPFDITAFATDTDGSEVATVRVSGLPMEYTLSAGTREPSGDYVLTIAELAGLRILAPQETNVDGVLLSITVTATEPSNNSMAETIQTVRLTVQNVAPVLSGLTVPAFGFVRTPILVDLGQFADPGAEPTWLITVLWGDGSSTILNASQAGPIGNLEHFYELPGSYTITLQVFDGTDTTQQFERISITPPPPPPVNLAPNAVDDAATTLAGSPVFVDVLANDTDPEANPITIVQVSEGSNGTTSLINGLVRYEPNPGFVGTDTFTYLIQDGQGNSDTASVTVTVELPPPPPPPPPPPVNLPPIALDDVGSTLAGTPVVLNVLANDSDPEGNPITIIDVATPANGTVAIVEGQLRYLSNPGFSGEDRFTYTISDGNGNTSTATVAVTVDALLPSPPPPPPPPPPPVPINRPPLAVADAFNTSFETAITFDVLSNDADPDGNTISLVSTTQPAHGTLELVDGQLRYTPALDFSGTDMFEYTIDDGHDNRATALVTISVAAPPSPNPTEPSVPIVPPPPIQQPPSVSPPILTPTSPRSEMATLEQELLNVPGVTSTRRRVFGPTSFPRPAESHDASGPTGEVSTSPEFGGPAGDGPESGQVPVGFLVLAFNDPSQPLSTSGRLSIEPVSASSGNTLSSPASFGLATYQPERPPATVLPLDPTAPTAGFGESEGENLQLIDDLYRDFAPVPVKGEPPPKKAEAPNDAAPMNVPAKTEVGLANPEQPRRAEDPLLGWAAFAFLGVAAVAAAPVADRFAMRTDTRPRMSWKTELDEDES